MLVGQHADFAARGEIHRIDANPTLVAIGQQGDALFERIVVNGLELGRSPPLGPEGTVESGFEIGAGGYSFAGLDGGNGRPAQRECYG